MEMPNATFLGFSEDGPRRERFMGETVNTYSLARNQSVPEVLEQMAHTVRPTSRLTDHEGGRG
jgi:hypothetical protein